MIGLDFPVLASRESWSQRAVRCLECFQCDFADLVTGSAALTQITSRWSLNKPLNYTFSSFVL